MSTAAVDPISLRLAESVLRGVRAGLAFYQAVRLVRLCEQYRVSFNPEHYRGTFDLPAGWVAGWVGGPVYGRARDGGPLMPERARELGLGWHPTIYVGVSPEGESHS